MIPRKQGTLISMNKAQTHSQELKQQMQVFTRSSLYILQLSVQHFYGIPECVNEWVSDSHTLSWDFPFCWFSLSNFDMTAFVLSYHILCCNFLCLRNLIFSIERKKVNRLCLQQTFGITCRRRVRRNQIEPRELPECNSFS